MLEQEQTEETPVVNPNQDFLNLLNQLPGAPTPDEIENGNKSGEMFLFLPFQIKKYFFSGRLLELNIKIFKLKHNLK